MGLSKKNNRPGIVYWHGSSNSRQVALTFDDGPNDPYTLDILDILNQHDIKATFFMIGKNLEKFPETARKVAEAGHIIGNHTYNHHSPILLNTSILAAKEIQKTESLIKEITSFSPYLFRPPYGATNRWVFREAERRRYIITQWSVNSGDWRGADPKKIHKKVISEVEAGAIILMHDGRNLTAGQDRSSTVKALPEIILTLKDKGYEFVNIPHLLELEENHR